MRRGRQPTWEFQQYYLEQLRHLAGEDVQFRNKQIAELKEQLSNFEAERLALIAALELADRAVNRPNLASRVYMTQYNASLQDFGRSTDVAKLKAALADTDRAIAGNIERAKELSAAVKEAEEEIAYLGQMIACPQERIYKRPLNPVYIE